MKTRHTDGGRFVAFAALLCAALASIAVSAAEHGAKGAPKLNAAGLVEAVAAHDAVFVDLYTESCPHCRRLSPVWDELYSKLGPHGVLAAKVDVQADRDLIDSFGVKGVPMLVLIKGKDFYRYKGPRELDALEKFATSPTGEAEPLPDTLVREQAARPGEVVILSDATFEHSTQAATGATTGDWLVEFYAPWCPHCQRLESTYAAVAKALEGEINVAKVDCSVNSRTCKRFDIRAYPSIRFLRHGKVYEFRGRPNEENLIAFAREGYKSAPAVDVPKPRSTSDDILETIRASASELWADISDLAYQKTAALVTIFSAGLVLGAALILAAIVAGEKLAPGAVQPFSPKAGTTPTSSSVSQRDPSVATSRDTKKVQ